jgi:hypothetical protein
LEQHSANKPSTSCNPALTLVICLHLLLLPLLLRLAVERQGRRLCLAALNLLHLWQ